MPRSSRRSKAGEIQIPVTRELLCELVRWLRKTPPRISTVTAMDEALGLDEKHEHARHELVQQLEASARRRGRNRTQFKIRLLRDWAQLLLEIASSWQPMGGSWELRVDARLPAAVQHVAVICRAALTKRRGNPDRLPLSRAERLRRIAEGWRDPGFRRRLRTREKLDSAIDRWRELNPGAVLSAGADLEGLE